MSLLDTCRQHIPRLKWQEQEDPSICIGIILHNVMSVKVSTTQGTASIRLRVADNEDRVIDFVTCDGKTTEIGSLFKEFRQEWKIFNGQLREILEDDQN